MNNNFQEEEEDGRADLKRRRRRSRRWVDEQSSPIRVCVCDEQKANQPHRTLEFLFFFVMVVVCGVSSLSWKTSSSTTTSTTVASPLYTTAPLPSSSSPTAAPGPVISRAHITKPQTVLLKRETFFLGGLTNSQTQRRRGGRRRTKKIVIFFSLNSGKGKSKSNINDAWIKLLSVCLCAGKDNTNWLTGGGGPVGDAISARRTGARCRHTQTISSRIRTYVRLLLERR